MGFTSDPSHGFLSLSKAFAFGGENRQIALLENEGIKLEGNKVDLKKYQWKRVTLEMLQE